jgi:hypothetical protein
VEDGSDYCVMVTEKEMAKKIEGRAKVAFGT